MAEANSTCRHCGNTIARRICKSGLPSVMPRLYCGEGCKRRAATARQPKRPAKKRTHLVTCGWCGTRVRKNRSGGRGFYCCRECGSQANGKVRTEVAALVRIATRWRQPSKIVRPRVREEIAALRRIARRKPRVILTRRPCIHCATLVVAMGEKRRICAACKAEYRKTYKRTKVARAHKRIEKARRRAIERGVSADRIDPIQVFERAGWRCYLCGCDTPEHLRGTYSPAAPELDHKVPLALGGTHTWGNVACACRRCNGLKGARAGIGEAA